MPAKALLSWVNNTLEKYAGLRIQPSPESRLTKARHQVLNRIKSEALLDVGANTGQYAERVRVSGFKGIIHSFEPTSRFHILSENATKDASWFTHNIGFGDKKEIVEFNISSNDGLSSSMLKPKEILTQGFGIDFTKKESVRIERLDSFILDKKLDNLYLKLDVQGAEMSALIGLGDSIGRVSAIEFESAFIELYEGETNHYVIAEWLIARDFIPYQSVNTHWDATGLTVSLDCIFVRKGLI